MNIPIKNSAGLVKLASIMKNAARIDDAFIPNLIGKVEAPSARSPSTSSISLTISLAMVIRNAKNPRSIDINTDPRTTPAKTKHRPVKKAILRFPIRQDCLSLYAYKNIKIALKTTIMPGTIPSASAMMVAITKSITEYIAADL